MAGGTGSSSEDPEMPPFLPDRAEPGTANVPGIAGLAAGLAYLNRTGTDGVFRRAHREMKACIRDLQALDLRVFAGEDQVATVSFLPPGDCEAVAKKLGDRGIAVRAGLHCAPLAHESAGTLDTGTVRLSFGHDAKPQNREFLRRVLPDCL